MRKIISTLLLLTVSALLCLSLLSCDEATSETVITPNANAEYARDALEAAGYNVIYTEGLQASIMNSSATAIISATKGSESINIIYYSDSSAASTQYVKMAEDHRIEKEIAENFGREYNYEVGIADKSAYGVYLVYLGTPEAINAAR